ncbi:MAG: hypothetical protein Q9183_004406, partial [Haloplaca sp. 2 TL-2023]
MAMLFVAIWLLAGLCQAYPSKSFGSSVAADKSLLWGPYRPNVYVGLRPQIPNSASIGLMWSTADGTGEIDKTLRHTCEQDEGMAGYGWNDYDVRKGGTHVVNDTRNKLDVISYFIRDTDSTHPDQWILRVVAQPRPDALNSQHSTIFVYLGIEAPESSAECERDHGTGAPKNDIRCRGKVAGLGDLDIQLSEDTVSSQPPLTHVTSMMVPVETVWQTKRILMEQLQNDASPRAQIHDSPGEGNLHFIQKIFHGSCQFDIRFSPGKKSTKPKAAALTQKITDTQAAFVSRFASTFSPRSPFQDQKFATFSKYLVSNLMGGVGFFHGNAKVESTTPLPYGDTIKAGDPTNVQDKGPLQLLSAVPSRPFFPRGFLWDEGYHLQVMIHWDIDFAVTIVQSWFDLMDDDGWIA